MIKKTHDVSRLAASQVNSDGYLSCSTIVNLNGKTFTGWRKNVRRMVKNNIKLLLKSYLII